MIFNFNTSFRGEAHMLRIYL